MSLDEAEATLMLVGTWRLTAFEDRADEESEWASYGTDPQGIIIYDPANIISVHQVARGPLPSAIGYVGYWGTYGDRLRLGDGRTTRRLLERVHSF